MGVLEKYIKGYVKDKRGKNIEVIIDYKDFVKLESIIEEYGLAKAMDEVKDEETLTLKEAKEMLKM